MLLCEGAERLQVLPAHTRLLHHLQACAVHVPERDPCQYCHVQLYECLQLCSEGRDHARLVGEAEALCQLSCTACAMHAKSGAHACPIRLADFPPSAH